MRRLGLLGVALPAAVLAAALAAAEAARRARLEPVLVQGGSMRPTLQPGDRIAVSPLDGPPRRGALVLVRPPGGQPAEVVKRVVGLPGEHVRIARGRLEVDGLPLPEPYLHGRPASAHDHELRLGPGEYLVLGDHRLASTDGRSFGPVRADQLTGLVRFAYWPPRRLARSCQQVPDR